MAVAGNCSWRDSILKLLPCHTWMNQFWSSDKWNFPSSQSSSKEAASFPRRNWPQSLRPTHTFRGGLIWQLLALLACSLHSCPYGSSTVVKLPLFKLMLKSWDWAVRIFHKLYLLNRKLFDWRRGAGYIPSSFCLSPVLAAVEDLSKAVEGSVRSLPTVFISEPEPDVSISLPLQAGVTAASTNYSCIQGTATWFSQSETI